MKRRNEDLFLRLNIKASFVLNWIRTKVRTSQKLLFKTVKHMSNFCPFELLSTWTHQNVQRDHYLAGLGLTDGLAQDLLDDDLLDGDQDVLDELRVGRCCLKTFYCATFISVVSQEFVFQKPSKNDKNCISFPSNGLLFSFQSKRYQLIRISKT